MTWRFVPPSQGYNADKHSATTPQSLVLKAFLKPFGILAHRPSSVPNYQMTGLDSAAY